jgi:hypothetical protein
MIYSVLMIYQLLQCSTVVAGLNQENLPLVRASPDLLFGAFEVNLAISKYPTRLCQLDLNGFYHATRT